MQRPWMWSTPPSRRGCTCLAQEQAQTATKKPRGRSKKRVRAARLGDLQLYLLTSPHALGASARRLSRIGRVGHSVFRSRTTHQGPMAECTSAWRSNISCKTQKSKHRNQGTESGKRTSLEPLIRKPTDSRLLNPFPQVGESFSMSRTFGQRRRPL